MFVPELSGLSDATEILTPSAESSQPAAHTADLLEVTKSLRRFGRESARLLASTGIPRSHPAVEEPNRELQNRQSCASGTTFYSCANGFRGCCFVNPCNPSGGCPDAKTTSRASAAQTKTSEASATKTEAAPRTTGASEKPSTTQEIKTSGTTKAESQTARSSIIAASSTVSSTAPTSTTNAAATPAPSCPAGNGTIFTDGSKIDYKIHCNSDNSYSSFKTITVGVGGYDQCFSACSISNQCAGFTFVGLDDGSCYLKQQLPASDFVAKNGTNYISCSKVDPTAAAPSPTPSSNASSGKKKTLAGAIAGGVIGGLAFLALLLFLIAFIARRRRKKIEEKRATITHIIQGPIETQQMLDNSGAPAAHGRSGSTAHDAFAPFGGFYTGLSSARADHQMEAEKARAAEAGRMTPDRPPPSLPPGMRAEAGGMALPPAVYKRPSNPSGEAVAMLDGTPIQRPVSQSSRTSSKFREHIAEMEDTSFHRPTPTVTSATRCPKTPETDSPTLGRNSGLSTTSLADQVRRRQHLMSWNSHESDPDGAEQEMAATMTPKSPPAAMMGPEGVSPDRSQMPMDRPFVVSPMNSVDFGRPEGR